MTNKIEIISQTVGSNEPLSRTNDTLKDIDNLIWVLEIPEEERMEWLLFCRWVRQADRYLERDNFPQLTFHPDLNGSYNFQGFVADWRRLRHGIEVTESPEADLFHKLKQRWEREGLKERDLKVWDLYLTSLERFVRPDLVIRDMREYRQALYGLSGTFFKGFPSAPRGYQQQIGVLGTLDQFYNNIRDLYEDLARGINYFPSSLLTKFGIKSEELIELVGNPDKRFVEMVQYLLTSFVPTVEIKAQPLLSPKWQKSPECPYSWRFMMTNNQIRYNRVRCTLESCRYNGLQFVSEYGKRVEDELPPEQRAELVHLLQKR